MENNHPSDKKSISLDFLLFFRRVVVFRHKNGTEITAPERT